jgi:hypothetical protein
MNSFFIGCLVKQKDVLGHRVEREHSMTPWDGSGYVV